jgi:hypothetical protein
VHCLPYTPCTLLPLVGCPPPHHPYIVYITASFINEWSFEAFEED